MNDELNPYGSINVSAKAIASIAYQAAIKSYGVVGLASKNLVNGLTNKIVKDPTNGIEVNYEDDKVDIDIYIVVQYGTRVKSVANSVANTVRFNVEKYLGLPIHDVNVHVQGLRINGE